MDKKKYIPQEIMNDIKMRARKFSENNKFIYTDDPNHEKQTDYWTMIFIKEYWENKDER